MSLSLKMLPCKKRRTAVVGPEKEDLGAPSDVPSIEMETSISGGASQLCSPAAPTEGQEDPILSGRKGLPCPPAGSPPSLSPTPPGDHSLFDDDAGTAQKGCPEGSESPLRDGKLSPEERVDCRQGPKTVPSLEFLVDKEEEKLDLTVGRALPESVAPWESGEAPPGEKALELAPEMKDEAEETGLFIPVEPDDGGKRKRRKAVKRKREGKAPEGDEEGPLACELKLDNTLDRTLEDGAKQHNLTAVNVRNILHEVITNEHVVAMMKAAISETEDVPIFEPKMTRSKLKEVVEKGVVIPTWNISPIKKANEIKPPQFVDIPLEEDDSSDEEYQPEEEEEEETAEETLMESDVESTASSPRGPKRPRSGQSSDAIETDEEAAVSAMEAEKAATPPMQRHISAEVVPMGPPPPPKPKPSKDSSFMEKLHAVDEELASSPVCMEPFQPLEDSLIALRTRSKRPLKDVPLGRLEAELQAPDITPDMYDPNTPDDEEWKHWLGGLMNDDVGNEDEADDDDDPEYNFLEDLDEPDTEDFRNDRAVRITKKEVNELMEELFQTFQEEMGFSNVEDEGPEDEDSAAEARPDFNTPQVLRFEEPLANLLNEQHRTVKEQLEQLRMKKSAPKLPQESERAKLRHERPAQALALDAAQRKRLAQQMQQHVQLLTQIHLLSSANPGLSSEANTAHLFLTELETFAESSLLLGQPHGRAFRTAFEPCNLKESLRLIQAFHADVKVEWSPRKAVKKNVSDFASLPKQLAWVLATRRVFMYPELLPTCSLKAKTPRDKIVFTKGEDNLLALGLKHFEGTEFPKPLISKYLLTTKTAHQLTVRLKNRNMNRVPDNILKYYKTTKQLPALPKLCEEIQPGDWKPPIEREEHRLPFWLKASLPFMQEALEETGRASSPSDLGKAGREPTEPGADEKYPLRAPEGLQMILRPLNSRYCRKAWRRPRPAATKPHLGRPGLCLSSSASLAAGSSLKTPAKHPEPEAPPGKVGGRAAPRLIQPAPVLQPLPGVRPLNLQAVTGNRAGFELQGVFSAQQPGPRASCLAGSVQPGVVPALPLAFQSKMILPALPASKARKPGPPRGYQKRKSPRPTPVLEVAPLLHPAPVIFTVPAGAMKVVSIGNSCNVLQPLAAAAAPGGTGQAIPITTLLVNPAPFPCPLSQPVAGPPTPSVVVTSSPACPLASPPLRDPEVAGWPATDVMCPIRAEPKMEPPEASSRSAASTEEDCRTWAPDCERGAQAGDSIPICAETADASPPDPFSPLAEVGQAAKACRKEEPSDPRWEDALAREDSLSKGAPLKEELVLGLGQELNVDSAPLYGNDPKESLSKANAEGKEEPSPSLPGPDPASGDSGCSFEGVRSALAGGIEAVGSWGMPEDSSGTGDATGRPPAGPEATGEREGPEEEEEEDFDDDIQDEEDEEMSSASEESVLSVPELQETMEKLTWLASERRLSQEGDSEEDNSPEENSEPEEEEEEEEEEGENPETLRKEDEMADEVADPGDGPVPCPTLTSAIPEVEPRSTPPDENTKAAPGKNRSSSRARAKRGRGRASKDTSKLLLLYDEDILERDPLREQKDLAFAQAYLSRVREALRHQTGKYEAFLRIIYEFESNARKQTAVDLYAQLRGVLQEWPQLLTDFAAFLLPEQALECGLFEEQQAFEKSRKFLRQLEICFAENPSHHQKIIKVLQNCAESLPQEVMELKTQMWQLLKGHDHLQDEFSIFFDHLRPSASRLGDFEEINWTEEKDYEFDGFEDVSLPDMEEEEEPPKIHATPKSKRRKEFGGQNADKEPEGSEGLKEFASAPEGAGDFQMKRSKRRSCGHKAGEGKAFRSKDPPELADALGLREPSPRPEGKEPAEDGPEQREGGDAAPGRMRAAGRRTDVAGAGSHGEGKPPVCADGPPEVVRAAEGAAVPGLSSPKKAGSPPQIQRAAPPKLPRPKTNSSLGETEARLGLREEVVSSGPAQDKPEPDKATAARPASPAVRKCPQTLVRRPGFPEEPTAPSGPDLQDKGAHGLPTSMDMKPRGMEVQGVPPKIPPAGTGREKPDEASSHFCLSADPKTKEQSSLSQRLQGPKPLPQATGGRERTGPLRGEEALPRATEAATVCAKNIKVSSTGEKVVLWTREADRVILTTCQDRGANPDTFRAISRQLQNKTAEEVAHRLRELMALFHTACEVSSEDEEDGLSASNTDPEEQEETGFEA